MKGRREEREKREKIMKECGRVGEWESGRVGEWESGGVGEWESGREGRRVVTYVPRLSPQGQ